MKEGLIEVPEDIVILGEVDSGKRRRLVELSLSEIPDSEAERIKSHIRFVKEQQLLGNNDAGGYGGFTISAGEGDLVRGVSYRVVLRNSAASTLV